MRKFLKAIEEGEDVDTKSLGLKAPIQVVLARLRSAYAIYSRTGSRGPGVLAETARGRPHEVRVPCGVDHRFPAGERRRPSMGYKVLQAGCVE